MSQIIGILKCLFWLLFLLTLLSERKKKTLSCKNWDWLILDISVDEALSWQDIAKRKASLSTQHAGIHSEFEFDEGFDTVKNNWCILISSVSLTISYFDVNVKFANLEMKL